MNCVSGTFHTAFICLAVCAFHQNVCLFVFTVPNAQSLPNSYLSEYRINKTLCKNSLKIHPFENNTDLETFYPKTQEVWVNVCLGVRGGHHRGGDGIAFYEMQLLFLAFAATPKTKHLEVSVEPRDSLTDNGILISERLS